MRIGDPFPVATYAGGTATQSLDWAAMARKAIHDVLRLGRDERVILSANPYYHGAMLDAVRQEIQRAGAIELATLLHWTPTVAELRRAEDGLKPDAERDAAEERAMAELFRIADVFVWLPNDWRIARATHAVGQSERLLAGWRGRGLHFHWFHDPNDPDPDRPANRAIDKVYERAVLELDYAALARRMRALVARLAGKRVRITNAAGTDLSFTLTDRFHINDGDASAGKPRGDSARDREEELPCGALRTIPILDSVEGVIAFDKGFGFPAMGYGLDVDAFFDKGLRMTFAGGRVARLETGADQRRLDDLWARETGDKDRLGEMVLGCNPLLTPVEGSGFQPYYGFGDGVLRLTLGENWESGGSNRSSLHRWLMFLDATISVDGAPVVAGGKIVPEIG